MIKIILFFATTFICLGPSHAQDFFQFPATMIRVIDGDTFVAQIKVPDWDGGEYSDFKYIDRVVRVLGVDTPELKPKLKGKKRKAEIERAERAKEYTEFMLYNRPFYLKYNDKFMNNRWVCDVIFIDGNSLAQELKDKNYVK